MKDFALLIVGLVAFIYGYFLMEKLDRFLEENQSQKLISGSKRDRFKFCVNAKN